MKKFLILLFIFILAFSIRFIFIISSGNGIASDEVLYDKLAIGLTESKGYVDAEGLPTSYRPPLYSAFLALIYIIFGHSYFIVRLIQAAISSFTVCLFYLVTNKIFNKTSAILVGVFSSFYMTFVAGTKFLYTETLFTFLLALITYFVICAAKPDLIRFCALGLLCGFLTLTRGTGAFLPFVALFFLAVRMRKLKLPSGKITIACLSLALSFAAVILPWTARNYKAHGKFVFISTNAGMNLYQGVSKTPGKIFNFPPESEISIRSLAISDEAGRNNFFIRETFKVYKTQPLFAAKMLVLRFLFFWNIIDWDIKGGDVINYHYIFILPFAVLGTVFGFKDKRDILWVLITILYFTSFVLLFPGLPRHRMPIDGFIIILGCYGIYGFFKRQKKKIFPLACTGVYFLLAFLLNKYSLETKYFIKELAQKIGLWY